LRGLGFYIVGKGKSYKDLGSSLGLTAIKNYVNKESQKAGKSGFLEGNIRQGQQGENQMRWGGDALIK